MGRRKKEPESTHRENIATAAENLFAKMGIEAATMDLIAMEARYSKATLYVYFANKEEIVSYLILKSMKILLSYIRKTVSQPTNAKEKYFGICQALTYYQEQYPLYFSLALGEIKVDFEDGSNLPIEKEIYETGEQINRELESFISEGSLSGEFKPDTPALQIVFLFWSSLSGLIQMASNKQRYLEKGMNLSKDEFLMFGFEKLFQLIATEV